jgi:exo-1,4-beta-D-glucosaminidase
MVGRDRIRHAMVGIMMGRLSSCAAWSATLFLAVAGLAAPACGNSGTSSNTPSDASVADAGPDASGGDAAGGIDATGADTGPMPSDSSHVPLTTWTIQSSAVATDTGAVISTPSYAATGWYAATVPTTVLGALVADGVYNDVLTGMNLRSVPGTTYPIGTDFLQTPVPADSPFAPGWWFRTVFDKPAGAAVTLHFEGISYRANVFLNGQSIADSTQVAGTYRRYDFDVTPSLVAGQNVLAVEVIAQEPNDLGLDFLDWNPAPADRCMGLLRDAYLVVHGGVEIRDPFVSTHLPDGSGGSAQLTVGAALHNGTTQSVTATLRGTIDAISFQQDVTLAAGQTSDVTFDPTKFSQLTLASPRLWWPAKLGGQDLYTLDLQLVVAGTVAHEQKVPFGVREITSTLSGASSSRLFSINGKPIFVRGGGYTPDILYRQDPSRQASELAYVLDLGLNTVRLEGKIENENFFYLADQMGVLVMPGLMCCDYWQNSQNWMASDFTLAQEQVHDQAMRLRKHPSVLTFLYGSDTAPVPQAEQGYVAALQSASWPDPVQAAAAPDTNQNPASGPTGYKMLGPYDYVPPIYWYTDTMHGGAFGFATEIGPGAAVPPIESLQTMLGSADLWPIDSVWDYHAGARDPFTNIDNFTNALTARYGAASGVDDFSNKSQLMAYESLRAMFEAYGRNKYSSATGVIAWMLNNAWPGLIWHLYDYYLRPGGAYFGAKKGNELVHVQYSYDDESVVVLNHSYAAVPGATVAATLYDVNAGQLFSQTATLDIGPDSSEKTSIAIPTSAQTTPVCFLDLELTDGSRKTLSSNFYWLTPHPDVMAAPDPSTQWYIEPIATYADFSALASLPSVTLTGQKTTQASGSVTSTSVVLHNASSSMAFFTRVQVLAGSTEILPVLWDDDYVSIPPGGAKTVTATYATALAGAAPPTVKVSGYNVMPMQL